MAINPDFCLNCFLFNYVCANTVVVVQSLSHVQLFATIWTAVCLASLSFTISWSLLKLMACLRDDKELGLSQLWQLV